MESDDRQLRQFEKEVAMWSDRAIPIAIQQTLNNTARNAWKYGRQNTDREFENRNSWTKRTQTYQQTRELNVDRMVAVTGASAGYLARQEEGFSRTSGSSGVWVPTADAADQSGNKRTKPVKFKFRRSKIRTPRKSIRGSRGHKKATSAKQANFLKLYNAVSGNGYMWGRLNNTRGMWLIEGSVTGGRIMLAGVRVLYSANKKTIRTPATPWHLPGVEKANDDMGKEYYKAVKRQLARVRRKYGRR